MNELAINISIILAVATVILAKNDNQCSGRNINQNANAEP